MALWSSTSSPKTNTRGSSSISCATPSRNASTYRRMRPEVGPVLLCDDILVQLLRFWKWTFLRELDGFGDFFLDFSLDARPRRRIELFGEYANLIRGLPLEQVLAVAVAGVVVLIGPNVLAPSVRLTLEKHGSGFARSHRGDRIGCELTDSQHVGIGDLMRGNVIRPNAVAEVDRRPTLFNGCVNRQRVVFAHEQDGQLM